MNIDDFKKMMGNHVTAIKEQTLREKHEQEISKIKALAGQLRMNDTTNKDVSYEYEDKWKVALPIPYDQQLTTVTPPSPTWGYIQGAISTNPNTTIGQPALGRFTTQTQVEEMLYRASKKTPFEIILDTLFSPIEKVQLLTDTGYKFNLNETNEVVSIIKTSGEITQTWPYSSLDILFLKEITIKFKNLLLAKPSLKIKI